MRYVEKKQDLGFHSERNIWGTKGVLSREVTWSPLLSGEHSELPGKIASMQQDRVGGTRDEQEMMQVRSKRWQWLFPGGIDKGSEKWQIPDVS